MKFLKLLLYILKLRFKNNFYDQPLKLLWLSLVLIIIISQSFVVLFLLKESPDSEFNPQTLIGIINLTIAVFLFLSRIFPAYQPTTTPIWAFHPMKQWQRGLFAMLNDIFSFRFALAILFIAILLISPLYNLSDFILSFIIIIGILMTERSFRILLDYKISYRFIHSFVLLMVLFFFVKSLIAFVTNNVFSDLIVLIATLTVAYSQQVFLSYLSAGYFKPTMDSFFTGGVSGGKKHLSLPGMWLRLYFYVPSMRNALGMGIIIKTFTLLLFGKIINSGDYPFKSLFLIYFVASPSMPFIYVINNSFGHIKPLWLTYRLHSGGATKVFRLYVELSMFPILCDGILSFGFMYFLKFLDIRFVIFYIGALICLLVIGLWSSLLQPKQVNPLPSSLFKKNYTSPLFGMLFSFPVVTLYTFFVNSVLLWLLGILSILAFIINLIKFRLSYRSLFHKTYLELHKV